MLLRNRADVTLVVGVILGHAGDDAKGADAPSPGMIHSSVCPRPVALSNMSTVLCFRVYPFKNKWHVSRKRECIGNFCSFCTGRVLWFSCLFSPCPALRVLPVCRAALLSARAEIPFPRRSLRCATVPSEVQAKPQAADFYVQNPVAPPGPPSSPSPGAGRGGGGNFLPQPCWSHAGAMQLAPRVARSHRVAKCCTGRAYGRCVARSAATLWNLTA